MRDLFVMRDTSTCIASQSEESVIVVAMVEMMLVISQTQEERYHENDAASILLNIISQGADMFSKSDLESGFHQLRIRENDQRKNAFTTPGAAGAQYEWVTCPFGLTNTSSCF